MRHLIGLFALGAMAATTLLAAGTARAQVVVTPSYYADGQYVCSYYYPFTCPDGYAATQGDNAYAGDASLNGDAGSTEVYVDPSNQYADTGYGYVAGNVNAGGYGYGYDYSDAAYAGPAYPCYDAGYGYGGCYGYGVGVGVGFAAFDRFHHRHDFDRRFDRRRHFVGHDNYLRHDHDHRGFIHPGFEHRGFAHRDFDHRGFDHRGYGRGDDHPGFAHRGFPTDHGGMAHQVHFNAPHPIGGGMEGGSHGGGHSGHRH